MAVSEEFVQRTEPYRRELLAHCYRMLGAADEAEDLVQETYLRAWKSFGDFEGRSSVRVWLYRIATNACLTAMKRAGRRALPSGLGGPSDDPDGPVLPADGVASVQPIPDPAAIVAARDGLRLALIASLQYLPPRQRAVFLLREVLGFRAAEVAEMLDTTVAGVKSALQRARTALDQAEPDELIEPSEPRARELLELYIAGFEHADVQALERALRADASIEMVGTRTWFSGRATCIRYLTRVIGLAGDWKMIPVEVNGQPAAAAYQRMGDTYQAFGLGVLDATATGIARIIVFGGGADLLAKFGLPPVYIPGRTRVACPTPDA